MGFGRFLPLRQRHIMNLAQSLQLKCHREPFRDKNSQRGPQFSARWVTEPCQGLKGGFLIVWDNIILLFVFLLFYITPVFILFIIVVFWYSILLLYYVLVFFIWNRFRIWYLVIIEWLKTGTGIGFLNICA